MNEQVAELDTAQKPRLGPGERLQAARISLGISLEEVAGKLRLSKAILSSLEDNQYDEITAPIFVKGYLRSYARQVNLDENDIIDQYTTYYTDNDPPITSTSNTTADINVDDSTVKWATWLIVIIVLGLLAMWWWNRSNQPQQTVSLDAPAETVTEIISPAGEMVESEQSGIAGDSAPVENITASDETVAEAISADEDATMGAETPSADEAPPDLDTAIEQAVDAINNKIARQEEINTAVIDPNSDVVVSDELPPSNDLVIEISADTWADIRDADGNKVIYDLLRSGARRSVSGRAPFRVFLGNGHGATLSYQGEAVDFKSSIRADNTARVVIGR